MKTGGGWVYLAWVESSSLRPAHIKVGRTIYSIDHRYPKNSGTNIMVYSYAEDVKSAEFGLKGFFGHKWFFDWDMEITHNGKKKHSLPQISPERFVIQGVFEDDRLYPFSVRRFVEFCDKYDLPVFPNVTRETMDDWSWLIKNHAWCFNIAEEFEWL